MALLLPLFGRDRECAIGAAILSEAAASRAALLLVSGEAGVGKSRLTQAIADTAQRMDFASLVGVCQEQDRDYPFAPFVDALRQWLHDAGADTVRPLLGEERHALVQILPELGGSEPAALPPLSPEQEKRRIFESLVTLLTRLCGERPLLLTLEDLHWADATTLELLRLLPRRLAHGRLLILATMRTDEPDSTLDHWLATLQRNRLLTRLDLPPLAEPDVAQMVEALLQTRVSSAFVATINRRAEGNPFFVEEIVHAMADGGPMYASGGQMNATGSIPASVAEAVGQRLDGLDVETRRIAEAASVIGRRFSFDLLGPVTGRTGDDVIGALRVLIANYLVIEEPGSMLGFTFRHALTRDAIYHRLLGPERRQFHRAVARSLDAPDDLRPAASADELGYHYAAAEEWPLAMEHASRAGDAARAVFANAEALSHYRRALDAARRLGPAGEGAIMTLSHKCATLLALLGDFDGARDAFGETLRRARATGDTRAEQYVLSDLAGHYASDNYETARAYGAAALAVARASGDARDQALALNRLANILVNQSHFLEGLALHEEAHGIFEQSGDTWGIADALDGIGMAHWLVGDMPEARHCFDRALDRFRAIGDRERIASCLTSSALYLGVLDGPCRYDVNADDCLADAEAAVALCREINWTAGEIYARVACGMAHIGREAYTSALGELDVGLEMATQIGHQQWTIIAQFTRAMVLVEVNDIAGAYAVLEAASEVAGAMGGVQWGPRIAVWMLRCAFLLGQRADTDLDDALRAFLPTDERPASLVQRRALFLLGEIEHRRGNAGRVLEITRRLALPPQPDMSERPTPATLLLRADALTALGRGAAAREALEEARSLATAFGPRGTLWRISAALAALAKRANRRERARAQTELQSLLDQIGDAHLRATLLQTPPAQRVMASLPAQEYPDGLSAREVQALRLIAAGMSNREMADTLSVSVRTVERHIENLYRKIDARSKADATAYAFRHRLT